MDQLSLTCNALDVVPEGTRTEVVEHRLPENARICSACGSQMVEMSCTTPSSPRR